MSTRKRTFAEANQRPQQTPSRTYAPSTPHAIRAHEERSGAKQRSTRSRKPLFDISNLPRPDSARGILRRLAQLTAPLTKKRITTPDHGQENISHQIGGGSDVDDEPPLKKLNQTLDVGEAEEDEDSEIPVAPTPSVLLGESDDDAPTFTFKSIDFSTSQENRLFSDKGDRRTSHLSIAASPDPGSGEEHDEDVTAELGRRATSEGPPTDRLPRYSFGSIRMSDFGNELGFRRDSGLFRKPVGRHSILGQFQDQQLDRDIGKVADGDTQNLHFYQRSRSAISDDESLSQIPAIRDENTFRLDLLENMVSPAGLTSLHSATVADRDLDGNPPLDAADSPLFVSQSPPVNRKQTTLQKAAGSNQSRAQGKRRKPLKLTRHGHTIAPLPSSLIKRLAVQTQTRLGKRKPKLGREHMKALEQATEWFFEQVGEDLEAYSNHARRRKRVDESDVLLLIRRQRISREKADVKQLASEFLSREVLAELDLPSDI